MIPNKVKALFQFIEYLHSNIDNFNKYNGLIKELEALRSTKQQLNPQTNHIDKIKCDEVKIEFETKFKILQGNTISPIKDKARELNVCNFDNELIDSFNGIEDEIAQLKKNFIETDLPEIFKHKNQYIKYRESTHKTFLSLQLFFDDLDEITKDLFDFFNDTEKNEFEAFEINTVQVNSFEEVIQGFKQGQTKFDLPNSVFFDRLNIQRPNIAPPQPTETKVDQHQNFKSIFVSEDYDKYILPLTQCEPKLLEKQKGKYKFIGNQKTQRGCVAQWFKFLKSKEIINQSKNRNEIASVLSKEIENFNIDGSSIDNQSTTYTKKFLKQLEEIAFKKIN